ncbi:hypothetical protein BH24ACT16_BH24ACT16_16600 [soil metagenome]|jgi:hypothetical protein
MQDERRHPRVSSVSWGRVEVDGYGVFKDARIHPGGAQEWDWSKTGTRHSPGVQPADVYPLLECGAETVIIGTGFYERLEVQTETLRILEENGVEVYVRGTEEAVCLLNGLEGAAALIHSTC